MHLVLLKFVDSEVPLVNCNKIHQLTVLLDVHVGLLDRSLQVKDILLLTILRLKE